MIPGIKIVVLICFVVVSFMPLLAQKSTTESHNNVSMRLIGHRVLLSLGDSTSRVLPIQKVGEKYKIQFATEISIDPDNLEHVINDVITEKQISQHYIVEVVHCYTQEIVHSYEIGNTTQEMLPCKGRVQPKDCYFLLLSLLDTVPKMQEQKASDAPEWQQANYRIGIIVALFVLLLLGGFSYFRKKRQTLKQSANLISIGAYKFDQLNMELLLKKERVELTSKEVDLLLLLYSSANTTVEREVILNNVWGDQGDYIGRTLDVFISKLRKKLEADTSVKIVNIRGVGYKLIVNAAN
jgi:DNA-binding winged helix-turn-helix (wHTH) protein